MKQIASFTFVVFLLCLPAAAQDSTGGAAAGPAAISNFRAERQDGNLYLSFQLDNAFDEERWERVDSGLPVSLSYQFQIVRDRRWWFDQRDRRRLEVVARYSVITMEYLVSYRLDDKLVDTRLVQGHAELVAAMTRFEHLAVFDLEEEPAPGLRLRMRATLGTETYLWVIPTRIATPWVEIPLPRPAVLTGS